MEKRITVRRAKWNKRAPYIEFGGKYLAKYDFFPGDEVVITFEEKRIVLSWDRESQFAVPNYRWRKGGL